MPAVDRAQNAALVLAMAVVGALILRRRWKRVREGDVCRARPQQELETEQQQQQQQQQQQPVTPTPPTEDALRRSDLASGKPEVRISRTPSLLSLEGQSRFGLDIGGSLLKLIYLELDGTQDDVVKSLRVLDGLSRSRTWSLVDEPGSAGSGAPPPLTASGSGGSSRGGSPAAAAETSPSFAKRGFREPGLAVHVPALGGKLHFWHFATADVTAAVEVLRTHRLCEGLEAIQATGGGAHKYRQLIEDRLGTALHSCNEIDALVLGMCLMVKAVPDECYTFASVADPAASSTQQPAQEVTIPAESLGIVQPLQKISKPFSNDREDFFPFLLCNVGTGVSILHVQSETNYTRVSGTALGGGTFLGLTRLLTEMRLFQEAIDAAVDGDARHVDMLVADIYGSNEERAPGINLPGDLTASFFAKNLMRKGDVDPREATSDADICKSLVVMIAQNVAQIAHLNARIHGARRVFFTGNFLRKNDLALRTIVYTMQRWSQLDTCTTEAVFFRHEGYFGAVGAFLQTLQNLDPGFVRDLDFEGAEDCSSNSSRDPLHQQPKDHP